MDHLCASVCLGHPLVPWEAFLGKTLNQSAQAGYAVVTNSPALQWAAHTQHCTHSNVSVFLTHVTCQLKLFTKTFHSAIGLKEQHPAGGRGKGEKWQNARTAAERVYSEVAGATSHHISLAKQVRWPGQTPWDGKYDPPASM